MELKAPFAASAAAMFIVPARSAPAGLTDTIDASNVESVRSHTLGPSTLRVIGDLVGEHNTRRPAFVIGPGRSMSFSMRVRVGLPYTLEFEEMYGRDSLVRGYTVYIDGVPAYFRTWRGCGAGPVHYFIQAPPPRHNRVSVRLVNRSTAPFPVSRVWAFSDFQRYFDANRMGVPYYVAPLFGPSFRNEAADLAKLTAMKSSLDSHPNAKPAFTVAIGYASIGQTEVKRRIEYVLRLARGSGMPVQMEFDTWWAQTPSGMDGAGGFWSDVKYIQVVYNATAKHYQLSVPNQWSSTPWLTTNNARLNAYKRRRLAEATSLLANSVSAMHARNLVLAVNLDNEPVYWANGNAGLGEDLLQADFNPAAVAAARRDGITLDPTDGLSFAERRWLYRNLGQYNAMIADAAAAGLGAGQTPDIDPLRDNIYTQAMVGDPELQYPVLSAGYPFWETAAPSHAHAGGEWNGDSLVERQAIFHQIALGRNAGTNAECGNNAASMKSVRPGYALAQRFVALYNYPLDKMDVATAGIRNLAQSFPAFVYQRVVREERFTDPGWTLRAVQYGGLRRGIIGNTAAMAICPASTQKPGFVTWRLRSLKGPWKSLSLELDGRAFNYGKTDPAVFVRVMAGPSQVAESMREFARFHDGGISPSDRVDLTPAARGRSTMFVRIEFAAPTIPASVLSWCSIWKARFTTGWPPEVLKGLPQDKSLATVRKQNLVVSWRADAEAAIAELRAKHLDARVAKAAYRRGAYADAFHIANRELTARSKRSKGDDDLKSARTLSGEFGGLTGWPGEFTVIGVDGSDFVLTDANTAVTRNSRPATLAELRHGDVVTVRMATDSTAISVAASGETIEAIVASFGQVTPYEMPFVVIKGDRKMTINMDATVHTPGVDATMKSIPLGTVDIGPGDRVRVRIGALGRAYEIWKLPAQ